MGFTHWYLWATLAMPMNVLCSKRHVNTSAVDIHVSYYHNYVESVTVRVL